MDEKQPSTIMGRRQKIALGIGITLLILFSGPRLDSDLGNEWIVGDERALIIAHRGGADIFPENTMIAFEGAAMIGVDMIEMDFQLTSDNRLITMHDDTVDRTTNGTGLVIDMTLEELLDLDASAKFSNLTGGNPWNESHLPPVTIEEVLDRFIDSPHRLSLEIKNEGDAGAISAEIMSQEVKNRSMQERVEVGSFHIDSIHAFREISGGEIATSGVESEIRKCILIPMLQLDRWWLDPGPASVLQIPTEGGGFNLATEGVVNRAHQHGQAVQYWTINDKEMMEHLIDIGADGIMTDNPILLRQAISDAGYDLPQPWT